MTDGMLYGNGLVLADSLHTWDRFECLAFCGQHFAARWFIDYRLGEECTCYDQVDCIMPWYDDITLFEAWDNIYTKVPIPTCSDSASYCDEYGHDPICALLTS